MRNILILLLIIMTGLGLSRCNAKGDQKMILGNTPGNIQNYGVVATDGKWEYFWAGTTRPEDMNGGKLCKMKPDGSNFQILSDDNPCYINVVGDRIYYIKNQRLTYYYSGQIFHIRTNGKDRKELYNGECAAMTVVGDWIYFINLSDGNKIYKIKTDGSGLFKLSNIKSYDLQYEDGGLYFASEIDLKKFALYRLNILTNSKPVKVLDRIDRFIINNGWIYGSNSYNGIYKVRNDGTGYVKLFNKRVFSFILSNNYIYCGGQGEMSNDIYKIDLDGKQVIKLLNKKTLYRYTIQGIVNDYLYYWVNSAEWLELARMKNDGTGDEILINRLRKPNDHQ